MKLSKLAKLFLTVSLFYTVLSCQEDMIPEEKISETDVDMLAAMQLADEYMLSLQGRNGNEEKSITVLRYHDDKLLFNTNTDTVQGYQVLTEMSVTAIVDPGEYIFWYSGGGVSDLDGIEFDSTSQNDLDEFPDEINEDKMWKIQVPLDGNLTMYKYDILYRYREQGVDSEIIRLDPKIRIKGEEE